MSGSNTKRRDLRIQTSFETLYSTGGEEGVGVLADISYSGALLDKASLQPPIGTPIRLYIFLPPAEPFELVGRVVRHSQLGFAVAYDEPTDPSVRRLVDNASAMVAPPRRG